MPSGGPIRTRGWCAPIAARPRRRRPRGTGWRRAVARSRGDVASDEGRLDPHVGRPLCHGERELAALAAAASHLIPLEVARDALDAIERLKEAPRQHDVL